MKKESRLATYCYKSRGKKSEVEATLGRQLLFRGVDLEIEVLFVVLQVVFRGEVFVDYIEGEFVNLFVLK